MVTLKKNNSETNPLTQAVDLLEQGKTVPFELWQAIGYMIVLPDHFTRKSDNA
jgi:hypothetical protein